MPTRNLDALFRLWSKPQAEPDDALAAFAEHYTDPVIINGAPMSCAALVERARGQLSAFSEIQIEVLEQIDTPEHAVVAFRHTAKHTGVYTTPLGDIQPTGRTVVRSAIDILRFENGRIARVNVVADELAGLLQLDAIALK